MGEHTAINDVKADALQRAARTFAQGLATVALVALSTALITAFAPGIEWTSSYWQATALAAGQAVLMAAASYVHRRLGSPDDV